MPRVLDPSASKLAEAALAARGVTLRLGVEATAITGDPSADGVRLADGSVLHADLVVAATGVKPHTEFLEGSGVVAELGVDDHLATSVPDVVAAGDVAEAIDRFSGERYVHAIFPNAVAQAPIAAANLLGAGLVYDGAEAMNSLKHLGIPRPISSTRQVEVSAGRTAPTRGRLPPGRAIPWVRSWSGTSGRPVSTPR